MKDVLKSFSLRSDPFQKSVVNETPRGLAVVWNRTAPAALVQAQTPRPGTDYTRLGSRPDGGTPPRGRCRFAPILVPGFRDRFAELCLLLRVTPSRSGGPQRAREKLATSENNRFHVHRVEKHQQNRPQSSHMGGTTRRHVVGDPVKMWQLLTIRASLRLWPQNCGTVMPGKIAALHKTPGDVEGPLETSLRLVSKPGLLFFQNSPKPASLCVTRKARYCDTPRKAESCSPEGSLLRRGSFPPGPAPNERGQTTRPSPPRGRHGSVTPFISRR